MSQGAVWCSAFCGPACSRRADRPLHALGGTNKDARPHVYLKHKFSHPTKLCTDMFSVQSYSLKQGWKQLKYNILLLLDINEGRVDTYSLLERPAGHCSGLLHGKQPDKDAFH